VGAGFAKSLRRPGGNVTGLSFGLPEAAEISMALMKLMRPRLKRIAAVFSPDMPPAHRGSWWIEASRKAGLEWVGMTVGQDEDVRRALSPIAEQAAIIAPRKDGDTYGKLIAEAARLRIMTMGQVGEGAFMSYGMDFANSDERLASILDQVLRGAKPADIPFELPDRPAFELNRKVARAIGVEVPPEVLLRVTHLVD
jgi:putative ABC transport system substrate-binding protein